MDTNMNMGTQMPTEKKSTGATISIIVIVLVLAFGAYYFLKQVPAGMDNGAVTESELQNDQVANALSTQGSSTDIADIQKDLDATDFSGIDAGLSDVTI
ncbi:MAG: hypothetical protein Q7K40_01410 [bacterium]|nr:hypothetical protein [bacterium]